MIPSDSLISAGAPAPGRRLHRDHPAHDRRDLQRAGQGRPARALRAAPTAPSTRCRSPAIARQDGERWVMFCFFGGGLGGNPDATGSSTATRRSPPRPSRRSRSSKPPIRCMFTQWSLRPTQRRRRPASRRPRRGLRNRAAGEGRRSVRCSASAARFAPFGIAGGEAARAQRLRAGTTTAGGTRPPMVSKMRRHQAARGERVRLETPGGGGWGDAAERDPSGGNRDATIARG